MSRTREMLDVAKGYGRTMLPSFVDFRNQATIHCFASDQNKNLRDLPYIHLVEYQLDASAMVQHVNRIIHWDEVSGDPFRGLYRGVPTGHQYVLPYFNEYHHQITQTWQETQGIIPVISQVVELAKTIGKVAAPAAGYLYQKAYAGAENAPFDVKFYLVNTAPIVSNSFFDSSKTILHNKAFLERIIHQNLHGQSAVIALAPPTMYEAYIPGIKWCPAAIVTGIQVVNLGTINNWGNYLIPDAWEITLQIHELINENRDIYDDAVQGYEYGDDPRVHVRAIGTEEPFESYYRAMAEEYRQQSSAIFGAPFNLPMPPK